MYCQSCGAQMPDSASFCSQCGEPVHHTGAADHAGTQTQIIFQNKNYAVPSKEDNLDWSFLSPTYRDEFSRIRASGGKSPGAFNFAAFLLGCLWFLIKGCWVAAIVWGIVAVAIGIIVPLPIIGWLIGFLAPMIVAGARGTIIYYHACVRNQQIAW